MSLRDQARLLPLLFGHKEKLNSMSMNNLIRLGGKKIFKMLNKIRNKVFLRAEHNGNEFCTERSGKDNERSVVLLGSHRWAELRQTPQKCVHNKSRT